MKRKMKNVSRFWNEDNEEWKKFIQSGDVFNFDDFDSLVPFKGTHPVVMADRIKKQNWQVTIDISKKKFSLKNLFLYWFEKQTGIRPFYFTNYTIIR